MLRRHPGARPYMGGILAMTLIVALPCSGRAQTEPRDSLRLELAQMDSILFDALFIRCDAGRANALLTADVEFFDDRSGLSRGDDVRENSRRLAANCPAGNGVQRILLEESVEVHPIAGYGAVQRGVHHFVERGASTSTVGRFIHVWKRDGEEWKLARIISLHEVVDAARAAGMRR